MRGLLVWEDPETLSIADPADTDTHLVQEGYPESLSFSCGEDYSREFPQPWDLASAFNSH